jgi:hypothetical protein
LKCQAQRRNLRYVALLCGGSVFFHGIHGTSRHLCGLCSSHAEVMLAVRRRRCSGLNRSVARLAEFMRRRINLRLLTLVTEQNTQRRRRRRR